MRGAKKKKEGNTNYAHTKLKTQNTTQPISAVVMEVGQWGEDQAE